MLLQMAVAQINPVLGDFDANVNKLKSFMAQAGAAGVKLVVFPELAICGYPPEDLLLQDVFLEANRNSLEALAAASVGMTVVVGFAERDNGRTYNSAAVLQDGKAAGVYRKIELPNYGVFDEKRYFTPGISPMVLEYGGCRIGISICEDIWVAGGTAETKLRSCGIDLLLNLSASPFHAGKIHERQQMLGAVTQRLQVPVVYVNQIGGQDELVFDGGSMAVDQTGKVIGRAPLFQETLFFVQMPLSPKSPTNKLSSDQCIRVPAWPDADIPAMAIAPDLMMIEEVHAALILGTRDYVRKNGFNKVLVGLSGGIDSALTAALAVEALGAQNVIGVTMPSAITSENTYDDALQVGENLGIVVQRIAIQPLLQAYQATLKPLLQDDQTGVTHENLQARIRGNLLMALSNRFGWLVLTTGNKSETAVGYCTLYGDMAGGFAVIKDVPKTLVYELAGYINQRAGKPVIPVTTIERAPSAELRPEQKDEDSLPPYAVLDQILKFYVEEDSDPLAIIARGFDPQVVTECIRLIDQSEYKRRQAPPGIKITPKAFGRDRRLPITNRFSRILRQRLQSA